MDIFIIRKYMANIADLLCRFLKQEQTCIVIIFVFVCICMNSIHVNVCTIVVMDDVKYQNL